MDSYPCQLINPLCPDDLCVLPRNHKGWHKLGTMSEPMPLPMRRVSGGPYTAEQLAEKGFQLGVKRGYYDSFGQVKRQLSTRARSKASAKAVHA